MNIQERDILNAIISKPYENQRILSQTSGHSLGIVNRSVKSLIDTGYLNTDMTPTDKAMQEVSVKSPKTAIILAAGFGMRMVPINTETPKGLLEIHGEPLIERLIKQLHEVGVSDIYVIVGFMKEQYEYLIDLYGVRLIVNTEYATKNNLHSIKLAAKYLGNSYIIPCDIWCAENPFNQYELYSWYMVSDHLSGDSSVRVNRKMELVTVTGSGEGNTMLGITYLVKEDAAYVNERIHQLTSDQRYDGAFWEESLYAKNKMIIPAKLVPADTAVEINTYEQLRELDSNSNQLKSDAIETAAKALNTTPGAITRITVLKKGMTNRSFLFNCNGRKYIMRIPGEGTDKLINRKQEANVYQKINNKHICDNIVYINPENGYKITEFIEGTRVCDPLNIMDVQKCMSKLRSFHEMNLQVDHEFDLFRQIDFYESLWDGRKSIYKDYYQTKANVMSLKPYIDSQPQKRGLTHIDAVPDNFLFSTDPDQQETIRLIDWEYAGMQDPHVDIAMFCIYSFYDKAQIDQTIQFYFKNNCPNSTRIKIYCYIAVCGLLWSNWCEYKRSLGVDFGEYSLRQYRYAKDYYKIVQTELGKES